MINAEEIRRHITRVALTEERMPNVLSAKALLDVEVVSNVLRIHKSNCGESMKEEMSAVIVKSRGRGVADDVLSAAVSQLASLVSSIDMNTVKGNVIAIINIIGQKIAKYKEAILKATNDGLINFFKLSPTTVGSIMAMEDSILTAISQALEGIKFGDVTNAKTIIDDIWPVTVVTPRSLIAEDAAFEQRNAPRSVSKDGGSYRAMYCMSSPCASIYNSRPYDDGSVHTAVKVRTPITVLAEDPIPLTQLYVSDNISTFVNEDQSYIVVQKPGTYVISAEICIINSNAKNAYVLPKFLGIDLRVNGNSLDNQITTFQMNGMIQTQAKVKLVCRLNQNDKLEVVNTGSNITFGDGFCCGDVKITFV